MAKIGTGPGRTTPAVVSRSTIGVNVAIAIGEENGVYFVVRLCWRIIVSAAGTLDGKAKSYLPRSIEVAIWRDPAGSTCTRNPLRASASITFGSVKKGIFSDPTTPR